MRIAPPRSLLGQFIALHVIIGLIAAILLPLGVSVLLHHTADHYQRKLLRRQASEVARALDAGGGTLSTFRDDGLNDGMALAVIGADRRILMERGPTRPGLVAAVPLGSQPHFYRQGPVEALVRRVGARWIIVSQDSAAPEVVTDDIVQSFLNRFALLLIPIAALVPLVGALLSLRLTRRMKAVSAIAAGVGPRSLDIRLPRGTLPLEVEPLAASTNEALDRLEAGFRKQAAFAADIAHELRTPLALLRLRADAVGDDDVRAGLLAAVDRAARVVTQMLALADLERPIDASGETVDLRHIAEMVVADRAPAIIANGRTIALEDEGIAAVVFGYPAPIMLALENLIDNAARHTPPGTAIVVGVGPEARLSVSDDGPGVPADQISQIRRRFWRASGAQTEGMGVGLSIVERVAEAHGGVLSISAGAAGRGLRFVLDFRSQPG